MARPLRIEYPGAVYHITCRGNEKKPIFRDSQDRKAFLEILDQSQKIFSVHLFAYVLMDNHFHLLAETPLGNLSQFMRRFNITYTSYFNRTHKRVGHLYQGRYRSILVDKESYLSELSRYIHLNPVRVKGMAGKTRGEKWGYLLRYPWSSLKGYLDEKKVESFIDYSMVLSDFQGDNNRGRRAYQKRIQEDLLGKIEVRKKVIGQAVLGGDRFVDWVKKNFYPGVQDRECPSLTQLKRYKAVDDIIKIFSRETGEDVEAIKAKGHPLRSGLMDVLYRIGGLSGVEIGQMFGVDYSTVSQTRKRLSLKMRDDPVLSSLISRVEGQLSI
jgi:putative transposase